MIKIERGKLSGYIITCKPCKFCSKALHKKQAEFRKLVHKYSLRHRKKMKKINA